MLCGVVASAVLSATSDVLGKFDSLSFLASHWAPAATVVALLGFLWLWLRGAGIDPFRPGASVREALARETMHRLGLDATHADAQVLLWERFREWLGKYRKWLLKADPAEVSFAISYVGLVLDDTCPSDTPEEHKRGARFIRAVRFNLVPIGAMSTSKRKIRDGVRVLDAIRKHVKPWAISTSVPLSRFDPPNVEIDGTPIQS